METISEILLSLAPYAHFISFGLLMLSGINVPISEDIVMIVSASIAATIVPENFYYILIGCFSGAYLSDMVAYSIGRFAGNKILNSHTFLQSKLFNRRNTEKKLLIIKNYFEKYGGKTLFFGRFIPFGVRNILFISSGLVKLNFLKFITIDLLALICTTSILFSLGYTFGNNYRQIFPYLNRYKFVIFGIFLTIVIVLIVRKKMKHAGKDPSGDDSIDSKTDRVD